MKKKIIVTTILMIGAANYSVISSACPDKWLNVNWANKPHWLNPILTLSAGLASAQVGEDQTLTREGDFTLYKYSADKNSNRFSAGVFVGTEFSVHPCIDLILGLGYYVPSNFSVTGRLTQGVDEPSFNEFSYRYKISSQQLLAEGKLLWNVKRFFYPYFSVGMGAAFNTAYNYSVDVLPPFLTFSPQFSNHSTTAFTYSLGLGVDMDIYKHWRAGLGYRFSDFGKVSLGSGQLGFAPFAPRLQQDHLYTQEVMAQISYIVL